MRTSKNPMIAKAKPAIRYPITNWSSGASDICGLCWVPVGIAVVVGEVVTIGNSV